jgi:DNA-binding CsgD family transcriptional regulator
MDEAVPVPSRMVSRMPLKRQQPVASAALRPTGLTVLGDVPWGTHLSVFYETKDDLLDTVVPYFQAGLENGEFCIWATSDPVGVEDGTAALKARIGSFSQHVSAGRIEVLNGRDWYRDVGAIVRSWHEKLDAALAKGAEGLRVCGNALWIQADSYEEFIEYERDLDVSLESRAALVLCTYPLKSTTGAEMLDVARAHQVTAVHRNGQWSFVEASGSPVVHSLTFREMEVLSWVARGKSAWEIGKILGISKRTVDEHARSAAHKLGAANRAEASARAVQQRIIELDTPLGALYRARMTPESSDS